MTSNIRLATALSALLALASPALAQPGTDSGAPPPATPTTEAATPVPPARSRRCRRRSGREGLLDEGAADHDAVLPSAGQARAERLRDHEDPGRRVHRLQARFPGRLHLAGPVAQPQQHREPGDRQRRQHQPARRHRVRLQQLDRELRPQCAARSRHSRRAHQLPVLAPSQRDVGQGRLPADGRVANRLGAAQGIDADHDGSRRALRDQLRRRPLPPQRQRQRHLQPVRRQLHHGRVHDRDRRRGLPQGQERHRDGLDDRAANCAARC